VKKKGGRKRRRKIGENGKTRKEKEKEKEE
jgi:hypothetical protein